MTRAGRLDLTVLGVLLGLTTPAPAQPASVEQHAEAVFVDSFQADVTTNASLGGLLNTGNTDARRLSAGSAMNLAHDRHGLQLTMDFAYGRANLRTTARSHS